MAGPDPMTETEGPRGEARAKRRRPEPSPAQRALGLLVRREHSRKELERKLAARGVDRADAVAAVERMAAAGWQDDGRFAASLARSRAVAGHGPLRIRAELSTHGLDAEAIAAGDTSATGLAAYRRHLDESFVMQDLRTYAKAPAFLERGRMYGAYGELAAGLFHDVFSLDGTPRRHLAATAWRAVRRSPVTIGQLMDIADAGQIMPPKSTWFEPKLRSGFFIHTF